MFSNHLKTDDKKFIIWTRSVDDWDNDRQLLGNLPVLHLPCIKTQGIKSQKLSAQTMRESHKVVIFTSLRAASYALEETSILEFLENARIFCFGDKAKEYLEKKEYHVEEFEDIRSASEIPYQIKKLIHPNSFILLPGPKKRAFALDIELSKMGFQTQSIDLYETISGLNISDDEKKQFITDLHGTVFFASPSACIGFANCFNPQSNRLGSALSVLALGPTTADLCRFFFKIVQIASKNTIEQAIQELQLKTNRS